MSPVDPTKFGSCLPLIPHNNESFGIDFNDEINNGHSYTLRIPCDIKR